LNETHPYLNRSKNVSEEVLLANIKKESSCLNGNDDSQDGKGDDAHGVDYDFMEVTLEVDRELFHEADCP